MRSFRERPAPAAAALVVATLSFGRQIASWSSAANRYYYFWQRLYGRLYSRNWRGLNLSMRRTLTEALASDPASSFIVAHLPLLHPPFIFEADGRYRRPRRGETSRDSIVYRRQLRYTDTVLGEIIEALERSGRFDRSLLILTSDHSWRNEPDSTLRARPDRLQRVPLLIKWPGQDCLILRDEPLCELGLAPVVEAVLSAPPTGAPPMTDLLWQQVSLEGRARSCVNP
jgi:arylsulfatase A-like enzyme